MWKGEFYQIKPQRQKTYPPHCHSYKKIVILPDWGFVFHHTKIEDFPPYPEVGLIPQQASQKLIIVKQRQLL